MLRGTCVRPDEENDADAQEREAGERSEDEVERGSLISEHTEDPVAEAAAGDAHKIHHTVTGCAVFGARDLAKDGHVVAVKEAPADAENDQAEDGNRQCSGVSDAEEGREEKHHAHGASEDSSARSFLHPTVCNESACQTASQGGELNEEDGADAGFTLTELKLFSENFWHPVTNDPPCDGWESEIQNKQKEVTVGEESRPWRGGDVRAGIGGRVG